jgi:hypothetical protein
VAPTVKVLLDQLNPAPSFVAGPATDLLGWNAAWEWLVTPAGMLDEAAPNLAWYVFTHPKAHKVYSDWVNVADEQVSRLRTATVRWGEDETFVAPLDRLRSVPEFVERWSMFGATETRRGTTRLLHPPLGELRLAHEVLMLPDDSEQRLIIWLADGAATASALDVAIGIDNEVLSSPARLRVIG